MKKNRILYGALICFALFCLLTALLCFVDVQAIGPEGSSVGLATINGAARVLIGTYHVFETLSDILGYLTLLFPLFFAGMGCGQLIRKKRLKGVELDLYLLAGAYALMAAVYVIFEFVVINYRPVLEDGALAPSFPSSHTLMAVVLLGTAGFQAKRRLGNATIRRICILLLALLAALSVIGRLLSGVHWLTDILGGLFMGGAITILYGWMAARFAGERAEKSPSASPPK